MKKLLIASSVLFLINPNSAIAKTEGFYVGADALLTRHKYINKADIDPGFGVNIKHVLNYNNFYLGRGLFVNYNAAHAKYGSQEEDLKLSFGAKLDFGYDICDKLSVFTLFGLQRNFLEEKLANGGSDYRENSFLYGGGAKYKIADNVDLVASYQYSDYIEADVSNNHIITIGAAYKF